MDGEGVDEVLWDAVGVSCSVHAHRDELTLSAGNTTASVSLSVTCFKKININYSSDKKNINESSDLKEVKLIQKHVELQLQVKLM